MESSSSDSRSSSLSGYEPKKRKAGQSKRGSTDTSKLGSCRVCESNATGFHYGVNTCEPCKGFYRRTLVRKEPYVCVKSVKCLIENGVRNPCPQCRYKKCISVGMSVDAIKIGRYTNEKRTRDLQEMLGNECKKPSIDPLQNVPSPNRTEERPPASPGSPANPPDVPEGVKLEPLELSDDLPDLLLDPSFLDNFYAEKTALSGSRQALSPPSQMFCFIDTPADEDIDDVLDKDSSPTGNPGTPNSEVWRPGSLLYEIFVTNRHQPPDYSSYTVERLQELDKIICEVNEVINSVSEGVLPDSDLISTLKLHMPMPEAHPTYEIVDMERFIEIYSSTGVMVDDRYEKITAYLDLIDLGLRTFVKIGKKIPEFKALDLDDQVYLVKNHNCDLWVVLCRYGFDVDHHIFFGMTESGPCVFDLRKFLRIATSKVLMEAADLVLKLSFTKTQINLLFSTILFMVYDQNLVKNFEAIQKIHDKYAEALVYSLRDTHLKEPQILERLENTITKLHVAQKKVHADEEQRFLVFRNERVFKDVPPLVEELFAQKLVVE